MIVGVGEAVFVDDTGGPDSGPGVWVTVGEAVLVTCCSTVGVGVGVEGISAGASVGIGTTVTDSTTVPVTVGVGVSGSSAEATATHVTAKIQATTRIRPSKPICRKHACHRSTRRFLLG